MCPTASHSMGLLHGENTRRHKGLEDVVELYRVGDLLVLIPPHRPLCPVLVLPVPERGRLLSGDMPSPEEALGERALRTEHGIPMPQGSHELFLPCFVRPPIRQLEGGAKTRR
jgi:hypothetical protein